MKKLVRESLNENKFDEFLHAKHFMLKNRDKIVDEYVEKMKQIFKRLKPLNKYKDYDEGIDDYSTGWWFGVVEPGWLPKTIKNIDLYLEGAEDTLNELIILNDDMAEEALKKLNLPREIIEI
jgi:hypothetical protein